MSSPLSVTPYKQTAPLPGAPFIPQAVSPPPVLPSADNVKIAVVDCWWKAAGKNFEHGQVVEDVILHALPNAQITRFEIPNEIPIPTAKGIHQLFEAVVKTEFQQGLKTNN